MSTETGGSIKMKKAAIALLTMLFVALAATGAEPQRTLLPGSTSGTGGTGGSGGG